MKILHKLFFVTVAVLITACNSSKKIQSETANKYPPVSKEIYDQIVSCAHPVNQISGWLNV